MVEDLGVLTRFALASLATWRLTHLLAEEDGPADAILRVRARVGQGRLGQLMDCFYCLSVWVAAPLSVAVVRRRSEIPLVWPALSGASCLLERVTTPPADAAKRGDQK
jgi:hypothetical protein